MGCCKQDIDVHNSCAIEHLPLFEKIEKKLIFFLRFGDIEGVAGEHLIPKLEAFSRIVENCIDSIEKETGRLLQARQKSAERPL